MDDHVEEEPVILEHVNILRKLCRLCGEESQSDRRTDKSKYDTELQEFYKIDIRNDVYSVHPTTLCQACRCHLYRLRKDKQSCSNHANVETTAPPKRKKAKLFSEHGSRCEICEKVDHKEEITDISSTEQILSLFKQLRVEEKGEESQSLCPMEAEGTNSTLSDDKEVSKFTPRRIRCSSSGKFQTKTEGTPEQLQRRRKDRDRKKLIRGLSVFDKMIQYANAYEDASFFWLIQKDVKIHFCGSEAYVNKFKDNKPICEYKENSCIETRKDSVLRRINRASAKQNEVKTSPTKVSASLSFLPGLPLKDQQKDTLRNFHPDQTENLITMDQTTIENIQSKIFVRQRRKNPKQRLNLIENDENVTSKKSRDRGRGK